MEFKIGKIKNPKKLDWLTNEKMYEYIKSLGWENLNNCIINGYIWTQYLNKYDYKNVYLKDPENSKEHIIKQIINQLNDKAQKGNFCRS